MANLQNLEQSTYSVLQDYFKLLSRKGWVSQVSVNRILVLLYSVQFWWKYSVIMTEEDVLTLQKVFNCLGVDCLIPSMKSQMQDKVVINKRDYSIDWTILASEVEENYLVSDDVPKALLIPEKDPLQ